MLINKDSILNKINTSLSAEPCVEWKWQKATTNEVVKKYVTKLFYANELKEIVFREEFRINEKIYIDDFIDFHLIV